MKTKATLLALLISTAVVSVICAANDPLMGTWKLNESKSKFPTGATKNKTVVYAQRGDEVTITVDGVDGSGKAVHHEWTGKFDGKDNAAKGSTSHDTRAYTKVDAHTVTFVAKKDGKEVGHGKVVVAADGKSRTVTETMTDEGRKKVSTTAVYDKE